MYLGSLPQVIHESEFLDYYRAACKKIKKLPFWDETGKHPKNSAIADAVLIGGMAGYYGGPKAALGGAAAGAAAGYYGAKLRRKVYLQTNPLERWKREQRKKKKVR